jgi:hypothetical protein
MQRTVINKLFTTLVPDQMNILTNEEPLRVLPRRPGHQPQHHFEKVMIMSENDARAEVQLLTAIALQNCTASSTNKTYSSA